MYKILTGRNHKEVEKQVNAAIEEGFQPMGGVAVVPGPMNSVFLYQAVFEPSIGTIVGVHDAPAAVNDGGAQGNDVGHGKGKTKK